MKLILQSILNMQYGAVAKYKYGYATNTNNKPEFSSSGNITNICLLTPPMSELRLELQLSLANSLTLFFYNRRTHGNNFSLERWHKF